jgi:NIMA (never in mitosis gene a)-related kinase
MTSSGNLKIGDLNVSKLMKGGLLKTQIGTPYYMSPEIWRNKPYDQKSDMWSVGCVVYELCAQRPPFQGKDIDELSRHVQVLLLTFGRHCWVHGRTDSLMHGRHVALSVPGVQAGMYPRIPATYSAELADVIKQLLLQDPRRRPSVDELLVKPTIARRRLEMREVMSATLKAAIADEDSPDMLATIAVPRNMKKMTLDLPAPCYPDSRPHSPEVWPVTDPRRVRRERARARAGAVMWCTPLLLPSHVRPATHTSPLSSMLPRC